MCIGRETPGHLLGLSCQHGLHDMVSRRLLLSSRNTSSPLTWSSMVLLSGHLGILSQQARVGVRAPCSLSSDQIVVVCVFVVFCQCLSPERTGFLGCLFPYSFDNSNELLCVCPCPLHLQTAGVPSSSLEDVMQKESQESTVPCFGPPA